MGHCKSLNFRKPLISGFSFNSPVSYIHQSFQRWSRFLYLYIFNQNESIAVYWLTNLKLMFIIRLSNKLGEFYETD